MKIFLLFISFLFCLSSCSQNQKKMEASRGLSGKPSLFGKDHLKCDISENSASWELGYCLKKIGVLNKKNKLVLKCLKKPKKRVRYLPECERRKHFKKKICELKIVKSKKERMGKSLGQEGDIPTLKETLEQCLNNKSYDQLWPKAQ